MGKGPCGSLVENSQAGRDEGDAGGHETGVPDKAALLVAGLRRLPAVYAPLIAMYFRYLDVFWLAFAAAFDDASSGRVLWR
jgi:hypothetical protein